MPSSTSSTGSTGSVPGLSSEDTDILPEDFEALEAQILEKGAAVNLESARERAHRAPPGGPSVGAPPAAAAVSVEEKRSPGAAAPEHSARSGSGADPDAVFGAGAVPADPPGASIVDRLTWISAEIERLRATLTHPEQKALRDRRRAELLGEWMMARVHREGEVLDASTVENLSRLGEREGWLWSATMLAADGYVRHAGGTPNEAASWHYDPEAAGRKK